MCDVLEMAESTDERVSSYREASSKVSRLARKWSRYLRNLPTRGGRTVSNNATSSVAAQRDELRGKKEMTER
jgi:hypothetical protein